MDLDNLKDKAKEALGKLGDEESTDAALDKVADVVDEKTGGKFTDKIQQARDLADGHLGDEAK